MTYLRKKLGNISFLNSGQGKTVLCLHGIPGSSLAWMKTGQGLHDTYRVVLPDLLGFGQSEPPAEDYYLRSQASAIRNLLAEQEISELYLAGHDFGGPVAITMMEMYPELRVLGLVLTATNVFTDTYVPPPLRLARVPIINSMVFSAMAGNRFGLWMLYQAAAQNKAEATWTHFRQHLTPSGVAYTRRIFQRSLADLKTNYQAVEDKLAQIETPTLVLWGDRDPFFSVKVAERIQARMKNAVLRIFPATGHFVPEERPQQVAAAMRTYFEMHESP